MALVDYSSSEDEESTQEALNASTLNGKRPASHAEELPPLPASFHDLYATNVRASTVDDPNLHGGRRRHVPHVEGNWPTHVYLEWRPSPTESQLLNNLIQSQTLSDLIPAANRSQHQIHSLLESDLSTPLPLHISLSRSLALQTHQREQFLERLTTGIRSTSIRPFAVNFSSLAWYPNHDHTRWFLSLSADRPAKDELNRLLRACNTTAVQSQQPTLYLPEQDSSQYFHISLAWSLSQPPAATVALGTDERTPIIVPFDAEFTPPTFVPRVRWSHNYDGSVAGEAKRRKIVMKKLKKWREEEAQKAQLAAAAAAREGGAGVGAEDEGGTGGGGDGSGGGGTSNSHAGNAVGQGRKRRMRRKTRTRIPKRAKVVRSEHTKTRKAESAHGLKHLWQAIKGFFRH